MRDSADAPWNPVIKLSEQAYKRTIPGVQHILRFLDDDHCPVGDMILDDSYTRGDATAATSMEDILDPFSSYGLSGTPRELLTCYVEHGKRVGEPVDIEESRSRCHNALMHLDPAITRFLNPQTYPVGLEQGLAALRRNLAAEERSGSSRVRR